jgi:hypothetical protein
MNFDFHYMYDTDESNYGDDPISSPNQFDWCCELSGFTNRHQDLTLLVIF